MLLRVTKGTRRYKARANLQRALTLGYSANGQTMPGNLGYWGAQVPWEVNPEDDSQSRFPGGHGYYHGYPGYNSFAEQGVVRTARDVTLSGDANNEATMCCWISHNDGATNFNVDLFGTTGNVYPQFRARDDGFYLYWWDGVGGAVSSSFPYTLTPGHDGTEPHLITHRFLNNQTQWRWDQGSFVNTGRAGWTADPAGPIRYRLYQPANPGTLRIYDLLFFDRALDDGELDYLHSIGPGGLIREKSRNYLFIPQSLAPPDLQIGVNLRNTEAWVVDGPTDVAAVSPADTPPDGPYPNTKLNDNLDGVTYGWDATAGVNEFNVDNTPPSPELAGGHGVAHDSGRIFRMDLPAAGAYAIDAAFGAQSVGVRTGYEIRDGNGPVIMTIDNGPTSADEWRDATNQLHLSGTDWLLNRDTLTHTFVNAFLTIRPRPDADPGGDHFLAHVGVTQTTPVPAVNVLDTGHTHNAERVPLTELAIFSVDDIQHTHQAEEIALAIANLFVDDIQHTHQAEEATLTSIDALDVFDTSHALQGDTTPLTSIDALDVFDTTHTLQGDTTPLTSIDALDVFDTSHALQGDSASLEMVTFLPVSDTSHALQGEQVSFVTINNLDVFDTTHTLQGDRVGMFLGTGLNVFGTTHTHEATMASQDTITFLDVLDTTHTLDSELADLTSIDPLNVLDTAHTLQGDRVGMFLGIGIIVFDTTHTQQAERVGFVTIDVLTVLDTQHGHQAVASDLTSIDGLVVLDTQHGHQADRAGAAIDFGLLVFSTQHGHQCDTATLTMIVVDTLSGVKYDSITTDPTVQYGSISSRATVRGTFDVS